jgi:outer membrane murein-binding lipoprotein Lpp
MVFNHERATMGSSRFAKISNNPGEDAMKTGIILKVAAAVVALGVMAGCQDAVKQLQPQIDDLKAQVGKVAQDTAAAKDAANAAANAAAAAQQAANAAQSTANEAKQAATDSQSCCTATNEKIDRMFKKSMSK